MDDLCIKMIANTKKLKQAKEDGSLSTNYKAKLFQILESKYIENSFINQNLEEFTTFFDEYNKHIIMMFQKTLCGKQK